MGVLVVSGGVRNRWQKGICYLPLPVHPSAPSLRCHTNYQSTSLLGSSQRGMQIAKSTLSFPFLHRFHHRHTSGQKRTARVPRFKATANREHSSSKTRRLWGSGVAPAGRWIASDFITLLQAHTGSLTPWYQPQWIESWSRLALTLPPWHQRVSAMFRPCEISHCPLLRATKAQRVGRAPARAFLIQNYFPHLGPINTINKIWECCKTQNSA